jgi:hypothetical protein
MPKLAECLGNQESEKPMNASFDVISLLQGLFNMAGVNQQPPVQDEAIQAILADEPKHIQLGHFYFPLPLPRVFSAIFSAPKFSPPTYLPPPLLNLTSFSIP